MYDITSFVEMAYKTIQKHKLAEGGFSRWLWQDEKGTRELGVNEYGCADAVNCLYTLGLLPCNNLEREELIKSIQKLQNSDTGFFEEATHDRFHTTAHCIAALELLDAKPLYPVFGMHDLLDKDRLYEYLEKRDWVNEPVIASHQAAALYAAVVISGEADCLWEKWYFEWFWNNTDERTGFWKKGSILNNSDLYRHMVAAFHYMFNHEYRHVPMKHPDKMIDSGLYLLENHPERFGRQIAFEEMDWTYIMNRATRQTDYRYQDAKKAIIKFADYYMPWLLSVDYESNDEFNDLHKLFGTLCFLAELQSAIPGLIYSQKPLRLVLDRRPFI